MNDSRRRARGLLLATTVPLLLICGVLAGAAAGTGDAPLQPSPVALTMVPEAPASIPVDPGPAATGQVPAAPTDGGKEWVPPGAERIDVGSGAQAAAIFRRRGLDRGRPVVVFLHGWAAIDPRRYGSWITHLVRRGSTVVYPAYQQRPAFDTTSPLGDLLVAMNTVASRIRIDPARLVVAGHSAGGALAADYAASALAAGLPAPAAVFSVYPGRRIRGVATPIPTANLVDIPARTRVLVLAGERDTSVGTATAREIGATALHAQLTLALVVDDAVDDHSAPRRSDQAAQLMFWASLDRLIAQTGTERVGAADLAAGTAPVPDAQRPQTQLEPFARPPR